MALSLGNDNGNTGGGISLAKGQGISLTKAAPGLTRAHVGLGWDMNSTAASDQADLDAVGFLVNAEGKVRSDADFIFYNQPVSSDGSVKVSPDNRTGEGDGDDEFITVELNNVPADVEKVVIAVTIHTPHKFGVVKRASVRLVNQDTDAEVLTYDLSEEASPFNAVVFAELYRDGAGWGFRAVEQGLDGGLGALAQQYGVNIA